METILFNRGIKDIEKYLSLSNDDTHNYSLLSNIKDAVNCFVEHIHKNSNIHLIVDPDVDGNVSAAMIYRYIKNDLEYQGKVTYSIHTQKQHGISSDIDVPNDCNLLIVPDAGTNDVQECKRLRDSNIDILILDHHEIEEENAYAIVVNNQMGDYPNKNLCGAGIVYKFLLALDDELWCSYAEKYIDLVALANISDNMDLREYETRYYVNYGLKHIQSKLFNQLIKQQEYSIKGKVNIINIQFYITPIINALIRIGNQDEKELLFKAFLEQDQEFQYQKYNSEEIINENIYERVARFCVNAKNRQNSKIKKELRECQEIISATGNYKDKIIFVNATNKVTQTLTGLIAMKLSDKYMRPCLVLRRKKNNDNISYCGSGRNFDYSPISDLKAYLNSLELFDFVQGHKNAFGVSIPNYNVPIAIRKINEGLKQIKFQKEYLVDFILDKEELSVGFIKDIYDMRDIFCQGVKEPFVVIRNVRLIREDTCFVGKTESTIKYVDFETGIAFLKFRCNENDELFNRFKNKTDESIGIINLVGKVTLNVFNSIITPQVIIEDYEFIE